MKTNRVPTSHTSCVAFLVLFLISFFATSLQAQTAAGYWKFNEGSGTHAADSSGNAHAAILSNGVTWVKGKRGIAISADAAERDTVTIPGVDLSGTQAVTIAFWAKRTYSTNGGNVLFEASADYKNSPSGFALLPDDDTCHGIQAAVHGNEGTTATCYSQPSSGVWHHLALVFDKSQTGGSEIAFYVDGSLQTPSWNLSASTNTNNFGNDPIYFFSHAGASQFGSGTLNDLRIYNQALTAGQIQQVYQRAGVQASSPSGLVAAYAFNEGSGSTVTDASGNGNNGTISNATWTSAGKYGNALVFNGNALVTINDAASLHLTTAMTLEAWVDPSAISSAWRDVIYKGNDNYFLEGTSELNGVPGAGATIGSTDLVTYGTADLSANTWTHLAETYDGTAVRLFVNGVQVSSQSHTGNIATSTNPLQIGGDSIFGQYFNGTIDEVRVYNTALTQAQIQTDMNAPIGTSLVSIAVTPTNPSIPVGGRQQFTATGTYSDGSHQDLTSSATWTSSATSVATINSAGLATGVAAGNTTIKATSGSVQGSTVLTVTSSGSFTISASPSSLTVGQGNQGSSTITTAVSGGFSGSISLSASGAPAGTSVNFNPVTLPAPGSGHSTMTVTVGASTAAGTYPITVTGNSGGTQHSTTVTLIVTSAANFAISASPSSVSIAQGHQGTSTVTTTISSGFNSSIALSASGAPTGTTVSFNPSTIPAPGAGTSTMTITVGTSTPAGSYSIVVTGTGGGVQQTAVVTLTVTTGSSAINYVQGSYATPQGRQTAVSVTYAAAQVAGDLNVVVVGWNDSTATVSSVTDSKGNSYTRAVGPTIEAGLASQSIYYAKNIASAAAGANIVTVNFAAGAVSPDIRIMEYSGADPTNPIDVTAANSGTSTSSNSGSATTTNPTDLILGANLVQTITSGPGSGFTRRLLTMPDGDIAEDQMVTSSGSYSASAPVSPSGPWIMQMVAIRTPGGAPVLTSITVTPSNPSIIVGGQQQFTATGNYSDGSHQNLTNTATWTSSATSVATISSTGLATAVAAGTTTIRAASGSISGTTTLTVTNTGGGTFTISASPTSLSIDQGSQGTSRITTAISGGFNSSIALSATGMPTGTSVSFNPTTIPAPGSGNSSMTVTVGASTPVGTYSIIVAGNGGGVRQTVTVTLTVTSGANQVSLSWASSSSPGIAGYNAYRSMTSGGPYTKINTSLIPSTTYMDSGVQSGTYYYVTTAVSNQGMESSYSNQASATLP